MKSFVFMNNLATLIDDHNHYFGPSFHCHCHNLDFTSASKEVTAREDEDGDNGGRDGIESRWSGRGIESRWSGRGIELSLIVDG